jgi:hypothetical protein
LLRGTGTLRLDGAVGRLELDADRRTTWDGVETRTGAVS